jgi:hypothetical protein
VIAVTRIVAYRAPRAACVHGARILGLLGLALLVVVGAACGSSTSSKGAASSTSPPSGPLGQASAVLAAARTTLGADTAKVSLEVSYQGSRAGAVPLATGQGVVDFATDAMDLTLQVMPGGSTPKPLTLEIRKVGNRVWIRIPSMLAAPGGARWASASASDLGRGMPSAPFGPFAATDAASMLELLEGVSTGSIAVEHTTLDGVAVTEYRMRIALSKVIDRVQQQSPGVDLHGVESLVTDLVGNSIPATVWVDDTNHVRQIQVSLDAAGGLGAVTATIGFSDFGIPVSVVPPPANETVPLSQLGFGANPTMQGGGS